MNKANSFLVTFWIIFVLLVITYFLVRLFLESA
jgi:hypothetical protein